MSTTDLPEVWLRGASPAYHPLLQPVAHALLQAREEVNDLIDGFDDTWLWVQPEGLASVGFHLQHLAGVADRLFTYARSEPLDEAQLKALNSEKNAPFEGCSSQELVQRFNSRIDRCLEQLAGTSFESLEAYCAVGRGRLPSTVIGLLVHAAEHTMRHVGQLTVTVRITGKQSSATPYLSSGSLK